jgi:hypothetical protein
MKRFFDKINKTDFCWIWTASKRGKFGYGAFKFNGKVQDSHRVSWQLHFGEIPTGMYVCHKCDNPSCVNPEHLFLGSPKENVQDCIKKQRFKYPERNEFEFKKGHSKSRVLSEDIVLLIKKELVKPRLMTLKEISIKYDVSYQSIRDINCGRTYKDSIYRGL